MNVNFAERAHNHNWKLDPIVRSLLDTDFYKLLMLQFIWKNFPKTVHVTSEIHKPHYAKSAWLTASPQPSPSATSSTTSERPPTSAVQRARLARPATPSTASKQHLPPRLPPLAGARTSASPTTRSLEPHEGEQAGQLAIRFTGLWTEVTMWEVYCPRHRQRDEDPLRALAELSTSSNWTSSTPAPRPASGTRSSSSADVQRPAASPTSVPAVATAFLWQEYCVEALAHRPQHSRLRALHRHQQHSPSPTSTISKPSAPTPTSSPWLWPRWPQSRHRRRPSRYPSTEVLRALGAVLQATGVLSSSHSPTPSAPPSSSRDAPDWVTANWTGERADSKDPFTRRRRIHRVARMPRPQRPPHRSASSPPTASTPPRHRPTSTPTFNGRIRFSAGWGTLLTNRLP